MNFSEWTEARFKEQQAELAAWNALTGEQQTALALSTMNMRLNGRAEEMTRIKLRNERLLQNAKHDAWAEGCIAGFDWASSEDDGWPGPENPYGVNDG